jgi:predicted ArsR family transcriptional regulator
MAEANVLKQEISQQMNDTRAALIEQLKVCGGCTVEHLSEVLAITPTAVRQHLTSLERDGLIEREKLPRQGVGRPGFVYRLSPKAQALFPTAYRQLAVDLLTVLLETEGATRVAQLFHRRREKLTAQYRPHIEGKPFSERVETLTRLRTADGYMTDCEQLDSNTFLIQEVHCPLLSVAECCPQLCSQELLMFAELLEAEVAMEKRLASGDRCCRYRVSAPA